MTAPARAAERPAADPDWRARAACRDAQDANAFFPPHGHAAQRVAAETARDYCAGCPVRTACGAAYPTELGVWSGEYRRRQAKTTDVTVTDLLADPPVTFTRKAGR